METFTQEDKAILKRFKFIFNCPKSEYINTVIPDIIPCLDVDFDTTRCGWVEKTTFQYRGTLDQVEIEALKKTPELPHEWMETYKKGFVKEVRKSLEDIQVEVYQFLNKEVDVREKMFLMPTLRIKTY